MKCKLPIMLLLGIILSLSFISSAEFDNIASAIPTTKDQALTIDRQVIDYNPIWEKYAPIKIDNWFGIGKTLLEGAITKHTESCGSDCESDLFIANYEETPLIDDIKFYTLTLNDRGEEIDRIEQPIRSYKIEYATEQTSKSVDDYSWICSQTGKVLINGTEEESCSNQVTGSHIEYSYNWQSYNLGQVMPIGKYWVKISGDKRADRNVDWIIKSKGEVLNDWATWGVATIIPTRDEVEISNTDTGSGKSGMRFITNQVTLLNSFKIANGSEATKGYLLSEGFATLATANVADGIITFSSPQSLTAGTVYYLAVDKEGASFAGKVTGAIGSLYPISNTTINWTAGLTGAGTNSTDRVYNVVYASFSQSSINVNTPINQYNSSSKTISNFNCSANVIGATLVNMSLWHNASGTFKINQTTSRTGTTNTTTWSVNFGSDRSVLWSCQACDSDGACGMASENRTANIDSTAPSVSIAYPTGTINGLTGGQSLGLNYSISDLHLSSCGYQYNGINTTIGNCNANTSFTYASGVNSIIVWANDSAGNYGSATKTWNSGTTINSLTYNSSTYHTSTEGFILNASNMTSATLVYNGTSYDSTIASGLAYNSITMNTVSGNKSFYYMINGGTYNSSTYYQYVNSISLDLCNATNNVAYLNLTFKDETTLVDINASLQTSTLLYYLGNGDYYKTLSFYNSTSNPSYAFCFSPSSKSININPTIQYYGATYPQRIYSPGASVYTNSTTNKLLYLLSSTDGIYVTFIVTNTQSQPVSSASISISRSISGANETVGTGTTDAAGSYTIWLNPLYPHTITASKSGYGSITETITPTQSSYTLILNSGANYTYVSNLNGLLWGYYPRVGLLNLNTTQYFGFNVSSAYSQLVKCKIEILNESKTTVLASSETNATNSSLCNAQVSFNPASSSYKQFKGRLSIDIGDGYQILEEDAYWIIQSVDTTGMTLSDWFNGLTNFDLSYFNNNEQHREYTNILIFFLIVMIICAVLNVAGWDIQTQGGMIILVGALVWMASIPGFLNLAYITPIDLLNKYFVAIVYTLFMIGFATRNM